MKNPMREEEMCSAEQTLCTSWGGRVTDDDYPWYAARLFFVRQREVVGLLQAKGLVCYVPMEYREVPDGEHKGSVLVPVVRNLIFIRKDREEHEIRLLVGETSDKISIMRRNRESPDFYEIPHKQMHDFQIMCNPAIETRRYLSEDEAKLKKGQPVVVEHGPLKGLTGKLVRSSKKYYLLKEVPGMAVMIKVSRWCCKPV